MAITPIDCLHLLVSNILNSFYFLNHRVHMYIYNLCSMDLNSEIKYSYLTLSYLLL